MGLGVGGRAERVQLWKGGATLAATHLQPGLLLLLRGCRAWVWALGVLSRRWRGGCGIWLLVVLLLMLPLCALLLLLLVGAGALR